jgi:hypothetical protein
VAEARLDVAQPVVGVGRRAQRLGEHGVGVDAQAQLAAAGDEDGAVDPEDVAEVDLVQQPLHLLGAEDVQARLELHPAGAVDEVEEGHLALAAALREAAGDAVDVLGLLAGLQALVGRADVRGGRHVGEGRRERVDAVGAQLVELGPPDGEQVRLGLVRSARRIVRGAGLFAHVDDLRGRRRSS